MTPPQPDLRGRRALVTGGTGFIGGRLVERLFAQCGADVRVLVRNFARAPRIARYPVEMVRGDLMAASDVARAAEGCDIVFHCGVGIDGDESAQRRTTLDGTIHVLDAAQRAGAKRVVHVSTVSVYGATPDGDLDEDAPRRDMGDVYSSSKLAAENAALEYCARRGLPVVVVQPTIVYGPFGPAWTVRILNELSRGRTILVNGGDGLCNAVYVDDVVSALLLAATRDDAVGHAFLISAEQPVTWREFFGAYERMLGYSSTVDMTADQALAHFRNLIKRKSIFAESKSIIRDEITLRRRVRGTAEVSALVGLARRIVPKPLRRSVKRRLISGKDGKTVPAQAAPPERPINPLAPAAIAMHAAKTRVRIDKAQRLLGYRPAFDFGAGMARVEAWARWANLLGDARETAR